MDTLNAKQRSERMSRIRSVNTKPELRVRRVAFALGARYRLHRKDLPGRPDIVFSKRKKVVFVHGCFWHKHTKCPLARPPKSRLEFWLPKLEANRQRDIKVKAALKKQGWKVLVLWECETLNEKRIASKLSRFLGI